MDEPTLQPHSEFYFHNYWLLSPMESITVRIDEMGNLVFGAMIAQSFVRHDVYPMKAVLA